VQQKWVFEVLLHGATENGFLKFWLHGATENGFLKFWLHGATEIVFLSSGCTVQLRLVF
jgi:hypothetical protein